MFDSKEKSIEFSRAYYRPRNDLQLPPVNAGDEVRIFLVLNDLLEFKSKARNEVFSGRVGRRILRRGSKEPYSFIT